LQPVFAGYESVGGAVAESLFRDGLCLPPTPPIEIGGCYEKRAQARSFTRPPTGSSTFSVPGYEFHDTVRKYYVKHGASAAKRD
jgi:hypothetical protein